MAKDVKIKIRIDDNGDLSVVTKEADKASKATDRLGKATDKTNKSRSRYHKQEKGVAGATSNSTKGFAKQAQTIGGGSSGLVGAYATLAAHVFAVSAAFGVLQRNAGFKQLEQGIIFTGRAAGANLPLISQNLKEITDSAISTADAMKAVAIGTSAGFSSSQLEGLTRVAKGASLALGRDMTDAMDRLVRGAAKLEPEILDELGIMVRLDETAEKYASTIGKTANELSTFEKRMAFTNAIIEQGEKKFGALNNVIEANPYSKLAAQFDSLVKGGLGALDTILGPIIGGIASSMGMLIGVMGIFATGIVKMMVPALTQGGSAAAEMAEQMHENAKVQISSAKTFKGAPKVYGDLQKKMADGTATAKDMADAQNSLKKSIASHNRQMPGFIASYGEGSKKVAEKTEKLESSKAALNQLTAAQKLETQATLQAGRADVLNTASSQGLVATYKALTAQIFAEHAALTAETKAQDSATAAKLRWRLAVSQAGLAIKSFGIAILNAIPMIGQILFLGSMAIELFKKLFMSPPTALEDQLVETKKALEEFPNIIDQLITSYELAGSSAERFEASLRAQVGLMNQTADQMRKVVSVQRAAVIAEQAMARATLIKNKIAQKEFTKKAGPTGGGANMMRAQVQSAGVDKQRVKVAEEKIIDVSATRNAQIMILSEQIAATEMLIETQRINGEETLIAAENLATLNGIMEKVEDAHTPEAIDEITASMRELKNKTGGILGSFDAASESVRKINELFTNSAKPTGAFADHITVLDEAAKNIGNNDRFSEIWKKYKEGFEKYGASTMEDVRTLLEALRETERLTNKLPLTQALRQGDSDNNFSPTRAAATRNTEAQENLDLATKQYASTFTTEGGNLESPKVIAAREALLRAEQERDAAKSALETTQFGEGMKHQLGGEATASLVKATGFGGENKGEGALAEDSNAKTSEKFAALNTAMSPMLKNIESLGPDGPLISAAIEGTMVMGEAFTNMFETMSDDSATTSEKMAAGLQAAGAALNAIGNIQAQAAKRQIGKIDDQIAAEKKRDGQSKKSLEKIKQLEKKKEALKKKEFERDKKMKMAQVVISIATSIAMAAAQTGVLAPFFVPMMVALGAAQIAAIASSTYEGGGSSADSAPAKPSSISAGERSNTVDLAKSQSAVGELGYARGKDGVGNINNFQPAFTGARYRAAGGSAGYVVGEQGPELFMPDTPGTIVPAGDAAGAGGTSNVNFSISALDSTGVEDILMNQRANIISMIRESANEVGDTFLEDVDTVSEGARS